MKILSYFFYTLVILLVCFAGYITCLHYFGNSGQLGENALLEEQKSYNDFLHNNYLYNGSVTLRQDYINGRISFFVDFYLSENNSLNYAPLSSSAYFLLSKYPDAIVGFNFYYMDSPLLSLVTNNGSLPVLEEMIRSESFNYNLMPYAFTIVSSPGCNDWTCSNWTICKHDEMTRNCYENLCGFTNIETGTCKQYSAMNWSEFEPYFYKMSGHTEQEKQGIVAQNYGLWINGTGKVRYYDIGEDGKYYFMFRDPTQRVNTHMVASFGSQYSELNNTLFEDYLNFTCRIIAYNMDALVLEDCEPRSSE